MSSRDEGSDLNTSKEVSSLFDGIEMGCKGVVRAVHARVGYRVKRTEIKQREDKTTKGEEGVGRERERQQ